MGIYTTLNTLLTQAPSLVGVNIFWGEENVWQQVKAPSIVIVPNGGPIDEPGFPVRGLDPWTNMIWETKERVLIYCWAVANQNSYTTTIFDNYDAVSVLRQKVLQAFQYQRSNSQFDGYFADGAFYKPISQTWTLAQDAKTRMGRANIIEIDIRIPILDDEPEHTTIEEVNIISTEFDIP